jgi:hypothetical protein
LPAAAGDVPEKEGSRAEPFDPLTGRVSASEKAPAVAGTVKSAGSQYGEDSALLIVTDQPGRKGQALHAAAARRF